MGKKMTSDFIQGTWDVLDFNDFYYLLEGICNV